MKGFRAVKHSGSRRASKRPKRASETDPILACLKTLEKSISSEDVGKAFLELVRQMLSLASLPTPQQLHSLSSCVAKYLDIPRGKICPKVSNEVCNLNQQLMQKYIDRSKQDANGISQPDLLSLLSLLGVMSKHAHFDEIFVHELYNFIVNKSDEGTHASLSARVAILKHAVLTCNKEWAIRPDGHTLLRDIVQSLESIAVLNVDLDDSLLESIAVDLYAAFLTVDDIFACMIVQHGLHSAIFAIVENSTFGARGKSSMLMLLECARYTNRKGELLEFYQKNQVLHKIISMMMVDDISSMVLWEIKKILKSLLPHLPLPYKREVYTTIADVVFKLANSLQGRMSIYLLEVVECFRADLDTPENKTLAAETGWLRVISPSNASHNEKPFFRVLLEIREIISSNK